MSEPVFVDTNVLIYARDERVRTKQREAQIWLQALAEAELARTNLQVLNELTRWLLVRSGAVAAVRAEVTALRAWGDRPVDAQDVDLAWNVREHFGYQWFDCLLLAAAIGLGCRHFLTEDMAHGMTFGPITIVNPFRISPSEIIRPH